MPCAESQPESPSLSDEVFPLLLARSKPAKRLWYFLSSMGKRLPDFRRNEKPLRTLVRRGFCCEKTLFSISAARRKPNTAAARSDVWSGKKIRPRHTPQGPGMPLSLNCREWPPDRLRAWKSDEYRIPSPGNPARREKQRPGEKARDKCSSRPGTAA